jgi:hypothetical protein
MDSSVIIIGLVLAALFIIPVVLIARAGRNNKEK